MNVGVKATATFSQANTHQGAVRASIHGDTEEGTSSHPGGPWSIPCRGAPSFFAPRLHRENSRLYHTHWGTGELWLFVSEGDQLGGLLQVPWSCPLQSPVGGVGVGMLGRELMACVPPEHCGPHFFWPCLSSYHCVPDFSPAVLFPPCLFTFVLVVLGLRATTEAVKGSEVYFCSTKKDHSSFCFLVQIKGRRWGEDRLQGPLYADKFFKQFSPTSLLVRVPDRTLSSRAGPGSLSMAGGGHLSWSCHEPSRGSERGISRWGGAGLHDHFKSPLFG